MNRPRRMDASRTRRAFSGPLRIVASMLVGAVGLLTVGPVLGRGFEPGSGPAVLITLPVGAHAASYGWIDAVSEALRALSGVRPAEPEPRPLEISGVELGPSEPVEDSAEAASDGPVQEMVVMDNAPAPREPFGEVFALAALPLASTPGAEDLADADVTDEDRAAPLEPAIASVNEPGPPPPTARPRPAPTRAPILAGGLSTPPPRIGATPRLQQATLAPTASGQRRATSTPVPTVAAIGPTRVPPAATTGPTRVPTAVPTPTLRTSADRATTR